MPPQNILTPQSEDFPAWYQDVVARAEMADNGPVRGTMVIRPWGYAIWERMQAELDRRIKDTGAVNAYFPLFIPESYLHKEAKHVEGFSPELAVVTHGGGKELEEPVVVRPTSETIINAYFSKWVQSYRELPLLINQWANVVRWELRPRLFLRTTEFLWQEGHTAHVSEGDAGAYALRILQSVYADFMRSVMAVPVLVGRKTAKERFAGATTTWTCEGMMRDGKALQMATSHELGQNFAKAFDITFADAEGRQSYVWQTSWGASTRMIGALIMAHGDDNGLRLPPDLAPIQVVVLVVRDEPEVVAEANRLAAELAAVSVRVQIDDRTSTSFGRRAVDWEVKGVPVRLELGPRDVAAGTATLVTRHDGAKVSVPLSEAAARARAALEGVGARLAEEAEAMRLSRTREVASVEEGREAAEGGFAVMGLDVLGADGESALNSSGVTVRCVQRRDGGLPGRDDPDTELVAVVAKAY
ncbi:MAG TPA: proline--tRNA ligase [Acidimicrobiales bacterium]|nr:proline--tRNA ligase [Acidimicrobiales bacterium]